MASELGCDLWECAGYEEEGEERRREVWEYRRWKRGVLGGKEGGEKLLTPRNFSVIKI